jgi:DNA adenine methylase
MNYPGSKGGAGVWQRIISEMPPHTTYIEAFLGTGIILRKKTPAPIAIGVDASSRAVENFCQSLRAESGVKGLQDPSAICGDARGIVPGLVHALPKPALVYADPPYPLEVRSCKRSYYEHELLTADEHREILAMLKALPCMVIVSSYWSELYAAELADWRTVKIPTVNRRGKRVIEWLWCNFPEPTALHDDRFIGENFRERWRIKKRVRRWQSRLAELPPLERRALLLAVGSSNAANGDAAGGNAVCDVAPCSAPGANAENGVSVRNAAFGATREKGTL